MKLAKPAIPTLLVSSMLAACPALLAQYVPTSLTERLSRRDLFTQTSLLVEEGEVAAAEAFIRENSQALGKELNEILDDVDRGFDELGRQKARNDTLRRLFRQLEVELVESERVLEVYSRVTGEQDYLPRFQAKRMRIKGAEHTNHADFLWDNLEYDQAFEEYTEAIRVLQKAIPLAESVQDFKLVESCLNNIGYAAIYSGDHVEGLNKFSEALEFAEERGDPIHQGQYLLNLGTFYLYVGQPEDSLRHSFWALEVIQTIRRSTWEANALLNLGSAYLALDQKEEASSYLNKALQMAKEAKDRRSHGRTLYNLALTTARLGRWQDAADEMVEALQWYQEHEEVYARAERTVARYNGLSFLSSAYKKLNDNENAQHYMGELREMATQDPTRLAAYLADPHMNFFKWNSFRDRKNEGVDRF